MHPARFSGRPRLRWVRGAPQPGVVQSRDLGDSGVLVVTEGEAGTCTPDSLHPAPVPASHGGAHPTDQTGPGFRQTLHTQSWALASSTLVSWSSGPGSGQQAWKGLSPQDVCLGPSCPRGRVGLQPPGLGAAEPVLGETEPERAGRASHTGTAGEGRGGGAGGPEHAGPRCRHPRCRHRDGRRRSPPCLSWASAHWAQSAQQGSWSGGSDLNSR